MWYVNQDPLLSSLSLPAHTLEIPLQTGTAKNTGLPLPNCWRLQFSSCPQVPVAEHDWEMGALLSPSPESWMEALPGHSASENLGPWSPLPQLTHAPAHQQKYHWKKQAKETWGCCPTPSTKCSPTNAGVSLWEKYLYVPLPSTRSMAQRFNPSGKQALKQKALNLFWKELT